MALVCTLLDLYVFVVLARAISSFFPISSGSPFASVVDVLYRLTEPVFTPIRRVLPTMGPFDFTPLGVLIGVQIIAGIIGC
jgi:YggT family protein